MPVERLCIKMNSVREKKTLVETRTVEEVYMFEALFYGPFVIRTTCSCVLPGGSQQRTNA
jgi:hypothetical protein